MTPPPIRHSTNPGHDTERSREQEDDSSADHRPTGSYMVREYTPVQVQSVEETPTSKRTMRAPSTGFLVSLSIILGIVVASAAILGGVGNAFYVTRTEFTTENLSYTKDKQQLQDENHEIRQSLGRLESSVNNQAGALQKIVDAFQDIKLDLARHGR